MPRLRRALVLLADQRDPVACPRLMLVEPATLVLVVPVVVDDSRAPPAPLVLAALGRRVGGRVHPITGPILAASPPTRQAAASKRASSEQVSGCETWHGRDYRPIQRHRRRLHTCRVGERGEEEPRRVRTLNRQRSRWLAIALVGIGVSAVPVVGSAEVPAICRRWRRDHRRRDVLGRPARSHRSGAQHRRSNSFQFINAVFDGLTEIDDSDPENIVDRSAPGRVVRVQRGRHGVDVRRQGGPAVLRRRADPAEHVQALVGAGRRARLATTAT